MRLTLDVAGRRLTLDLALDLTGPSTMSSPPPEPDKQGATCGDLERRDSWDHDIREPVGFRPPTLGAL